MLSYWNDISFENPEYFWLFLVIPIILAWYILRNRRLQGTFKISTVSSFGKTKFPYFRHTLFFLRIVGFAALITAIARPQTSSSWQDVTTEGIDIIIAESLGGREEDIKKFFLVDCCNNFRYVSKHWSLKGSILFK